MTPTAFQLALAPETLAAAARLRAEVAVTVYAPDLPTRRVTERSAE